MTGHSVLEVELHTSHPVRVIASAARKLVSCRDPESLFATLYPDVEMRHIQKVRHTSVQKQSMIAWRFPDSRTDRFRRGLKGLRRGDVIPATMLSQLIFNEKTKNTVNHTQESDSNS